MPPPEFVSRGAAEQGPPAAPAPQSAALTSGAAGSSRRTTNLADARLGAVAVSCSDEFFGPMSRMLEPDDPVFFPDKYDDHGKWMDGWESRRLAIRMALQVSPANDLWNWDAAPIGSSL